MVKRGKEETQEVGKECEVVVRERKVLVGRVLNVVKGDGRV